MAVRPRLQVDEEEMRRWRRRLLERGFSDSTANLWISRIRTAYAHGVTSEAMVGTVFASYTGGTRSVFRVALRALDEFRRSA